MPVYKKPLIKEVDDNDLILFNRHGGERILLHGENDWNDTEKIRNVLLACRQQSYIDYVIFPGHEMLFQEDGKPFPVTPGKSQIAESRFEEIIYSVCRELQIHTEPFELTYYENRDRNYAEFQRNEQMVQWATKAFIFSSAYYNNHVLRQTVWQLAKNNIRYDIIS